MKTTLLALSLWIVGSGIAWAANPPTPGTAAAASAANVSNPAAAIASQPAAGVTANAALPAGGVAPNPVTPAAGVDAQGTATMFNQNPAVVPQAGAPPTTFGVAPNSQPARGNGAIVFPNGTVSSNMFGTNGAMFNAHAAAAGQTGVIAPNPPTGVTYPPTGTTVVATNPAVNPGTILPGSVLRNTGIANVAGAGTNRAFNSPGTTSGQPNGGVQWSGGRWWYLTPRNTWMWYNNGNWVNY